MITRISNSIFKRAAKPRHLQALQALPSLTKHTLNPLPTFRTFSSTPGLKDMEPIKIEFYREKEPQQKVKESKIAKQDEEEEDEVPISVERDKVFSKKKVSLKDKLMVMINHTKHGFQGVGADAVYLWKLFFKKQLNSEAYSVYELIERRRISKDLIKFIPYSVMMTVPLLEVALPFYMFLFPNSMPTPFFFKDQVGKKTAELVEKQRDSYRKIIPLLPKFANVIGLDPLNFVQSIRDILEVEGKDKDEMYYNMSDFETYLINFAINYDEFNPLNTDLLKIDIMTAYELEQTAKLLCLDYIPGYNLINKALFVGSRMPFFLFSWVLNKAKIAKIDFSGYGWYKFEFRLNSGPLKHVKKWLLVTQIKYHMMHVKAQDRQLYRDLEQLDTLPVAHLASYARQRGIRIENPEAIKQYLRHFWLPLSVEYDVPPEVLIWVSFMRYSYADSLAQGYVVRDSVGN